MKKRLILGIISLIISLSLIIINELNNKQYSNNIHDITNGGLKEENTKVYLNATFIAGTIKYNEEKFYVIFGDGVQYLVKIDDEKANDINNYLLDNPEESYKVVGITKLIPSDIEENGIKFVNNYLNALHDEDHEHNITRDDFYHYFGYVYLDTITNNNILIIVFISLTGIIGIILIFNEISKKVNLL